MKKMDENDVFLSLECVVYTYDEFVSWKLNGQDLKYDGVNTFTWILTIEEYKEHQLLFMLNLRRNISELQGMYQCMRDYYFVYFENSALKMQKLPSSLAPMMKTEDIHKSMNGTSIRRLNITSLTSGEKFKIFLDDRLKFFESAYDYFRSFSKNTQSLILGSLLVFVMFHLLVRIVNTKMRKTAQMYARVAYIMNDFTPVFSQDAEKQKQQKYLFELVQIRKKILEYYNPYVKKLAKEQQNYHGRKTKPKSKSQSRSRSRHTSKNSSQSSKKSRSTSKSTSRSPKKKMKKLKKRPRSKKKMIGLSKSMTVLTPSKLK